MTATSGSASADVLLAPLREALERFAGRSIALEVLAPPYPCAGTGALRVARAREGGDGHVELLVTYEGFDRL